MSFREKSAWITLATVLVCFGAYFGALLAGHVRGIHALFFLLICGVGLIALQLALTLVAALTTPKDGRAPRDEREILIQARSHRIGYHALMVFLGASAVHPGPPGAQRARHGQLRPVGGGDRHAGCRRRADRHLPAGSVT